MFNAVPFPEHQFVCRPDCRLSYAQKVSTGLIRMAKSRVVICGLARSILPAIQTTIHNIETLGTLFANYRVILYENDSEDGTLDVLQEWSRSNPLVTILSEELGAMHYPQTRSLERANALATYRNKYLEVLKQCYSNYDFLVVVDTDILQGWSCFGVANTFGYDEWDCVGSNGLFFKSRRNAEANSLASQTELAYFDVWAHRELGSTLAHKASEIQQLVYPRGTPPIPVWSCFGGLAIYRMGAIQNVEYGGDDCEHVILHQRMRRNGNGRIFMNPSQITLYNFDT